MSSKETDVFSLWYMRYVEERERDVAVILAPLLQFDWYADDMRRKFPDRIPDAMPRDVALALRRIVEHNAGNSPVLLTYVDLYLSETFDIEPSEKSDLVFEVVGRRSR